MMTRIRIIQLIVIIIGIALMIWGLFMAELEAVRQKGSVVCLECIGVG
ncbi:MAG: hypothetical protein FWF76_06960 [Oscillospiraceae bacterium]|nr:hypothetical protein [Oscillospiraceae bacterium]